MLIGVSELPLLELRTDQNRRRKRRLAHPGASEGVEIHQGGCTDL